MACLHTMFDTLSIGRSEVKPILNESCSAQLQKWKRWITNSKCKIKISIIRPLVQKSIRTGSLGSGGNEIE
jgi:hypothetical protein